MLSPATMRRWTLEEDNVLRDQVQSYCMYANAPEGCAADFLKVSRKAPIDWHAVGAALVDRSNKDCRKRWQKIDTRWSSGAWTSAEDQKLHEAVMQSGERWVIVSDFVATRNPDQCAKRWRNALDPNISHEVWTEEAERQLASAVKSLGRDWKAIAEKFFPARSRQDLSNRFALLQRKKRVRRSRSTSKAHHECSLQQQQQAQRQQEHEQEVSQQKQQESSSQSQHSFDEPWQYDLDIAFAKDQSLSTVSQALPASMLDAQFASSYLSFDTDTGSLDSCFGRQSQPLSEFAETFQPLPQQSDSILPIETALISSSWPSMTPSTWVSSLESLTTHATAPAAQLSSERRQSNTVMTIENLRPSTRAAIIEMVLEDGGSLRLTTKETERSLS